MSVTLPEVINNTISAPEGTRVSFISLARVSRDGRIPIDFLLAG